MKKINSIAQIILALGILTLLIAAIFFQFYTYDENGEITGDWRAAESIIFLGTARLIAGIAGGVIVLGIVLLLIDRKKAAEKHNVTGILFVVLAALTIIGSLTFFYPCTGMMRMNDRPMRCYWTMKILLGITGAIGVCGALMLFFNKSKELIKGLNFSVIILGVLFLIAPANLTEGYCLTIMTCVERFRPFAIIMGSLTLTTSVLAAFYLNKKPRNFTR